MKGRRTSLVLFALMACSADEHSITHLAPDPCPDGCPPTCPGVELNFIKLDAMTEILEIFCEAQQEPDFSVQECLAFTLSNWCPTPVSCSLILCGDQLEYHQKCVAAALLSSEGTPPQACLDFYAAL
jgi:hypothetical protein